ncbi:hypothetical protein KSP40_PGU006636 [Platanthera guangdongensis]|uniref:Uncharacterized protein n=1 Tax=Platanthera guangdongensis TaxID=2320717 RepID=A0ABR2LM81_9ASPA
MRNCQPARARVLTVLNELGKEVNDMVAAEEKEKQGYTDGQKERSTPLVRDPTKKKPKGISNARLKGHWETRTKKPSISFNIQIIFLLLLLLFV